MASTTLSRILHARGQSVWKTGSFFLTSFCFLCFLVGCQSNPTPRPGTQLNVGGGTPALNILGPGDVIRIGFPGAPELNQSQKIRSDGKINLPMIGDFTASGKTPESLRKTLSARYTGPLTDPRVLVTLISRASVVYVSGAVGAPRKVPLDRPLTAFDAIMEAGGFTIGANNKKVTLIRQVGQKYQYRVLDLSGPLSGQPSAPVYLKPYDKLIVASRMW